MVDFLLTQGVLGFMAAVAGLFAYRCYNRLQAVQDERVDELVRLIDRYHEGMTNLSKAVDLAIDHRREH